MITLYFHSLSLLQGVFLYWSTNNVVSILQSMVLKQDQIRVLLEIPKMPKPEDTPVFKMVNPFKSVMDVRCVTDIVHVYNTESVLV
jgi:membrane protein insertase Oxa1/YidC/SpoIIIJ